jgi:LysR family transcriptional activator of nhaA
MEWLNYHHLLYFYTVAREGGLGPASEVLRLAQPTLSTQIHQLESQLGHKLFTRSGRKLALTETGQTVYRYAQDIFGLGAEMQDVLAGRAKDRRLRLAVGVSETLSKLLAYRILAPVLESEFALQFLCYEARTEKLLADLATSGLDLILSDAPLPPGSIVKAFSHSWGTSPLQFFAAPNCAKRLKADFPISLSGARVLLPLPGSITRRHLEQWFTAHDLHPHVAGEFQDSALMKVFGQTGAGAFAAPSIIAAELKATYGVVPIGQPLPIEEHYFVITPERRLRHPAVKAILRNSSKK